MAYQHQTIHDFCLRSNIVYFPQRKVLIFFSDQGRSRVQISRMESESQAVYIAKLNLSTNQHLDMFYLTNQGFYILSG